MLQQDLRDTLAEWLRKTLDASRFRGNQRALSAASGVSRETIWRILGAKTTTQTRTVAALAEALGVAPPTFRRAGAVAETGASYDVGDARPGGVESQLSDSEVLAMLTESRPRFVRYLQARFGDRPMSKAAKLDHLEFLVRLGRERHVDVSKEFVAAVRGLIEQGGL